MFEIRTLDDVRGNNVVIYSIKTLLARNSFPKLSIMSGVMGVGKTSVAKVVAAELDKTGAPVTVYNFGKDVNMNDIQEQVFSQKPVHPKVFIFEEIHGLPKNDQNALLQMFDTQSDNVYVICTTTEIHKILGTIKSRAQVWDFKLLSDKQLAQLLDDYLSQQGVTLAPQSKNSLLKSCRGVPRDLLKNADFAIAGDFSSIQLDSLLGNVSDELMYTVFCALKSNTVSFVSSIEELIGETSGDKLTAMKDFWLRYLMERAMGDLKTFTKPMLKTLDELYTDDDRTKVAKMLLRSTKDNLLLELITMNMQFTASSTSAVLGHQKDMAARASQETRVLKQQTGQQVQDSSRLTSASLKNLKL